MYLFQWIEKHFWAFLLLGMFCGLLVPLPTASLVPLLKPELMLMLLLIFLKIDIISILENIKDYKQMFLLSFSFLMLSPLLLFGAFSLWNAEIAFAVLLLAAMPSGTSAPVLTDILKGNASLGMSITILTSLLAPFTLPLLFYFFAKEDFSINQWDLFWDAASMIFIPMLLSVILKPLFPKMIKKAIPSFTAINIVLMFVIVVSSFGSQRGLLLANPLSLLGDLFLVLLLSIILHVIGFLIARGRKRQDTIAIVVGRAYINNGLAIVLAVNFFPPYVLILAVLYEIPLSTMIIPLRWYLNRKQ